MNNPKAIFFDLDGTLVDTSGGIADNLNRAFEAVGLRKLPKKTIMKNVGYGADYLSIHCIATYDIEKSKDSELIKEVLKKFKYYYNKYPIENSHLYKGVLEYLNDSDLLLGVISNKPATLVDIVLREYDLHKYFSFAWGIDSFDFHKPDPEIIEKAMKDWHLSKSDVWFIGDSFVDIQTAKGAGVTAIALEDGFTPKELLAIESPDYQFKNFEDFVNWAKNMSD